MNESTGPDHFDPQAQAYVDGELAAEERVEFQRTLARSSELRSQVDQLLALKRCLREAYPLEPAPWGRLRRRRRGAWASAASLLVGIALGFFLSQTLPDAATRSMGPVGTPSHSDMTRVLLHVGTSDLAAMSEALLSARYILDDFADAGRAVRLHVVANGPGLDLLRPEVTPHGAQIAELERDYPNVQFVACQNTIEKLEEKSNKPVKLLPQVLRVDSGVADIARKRAGGWLYIGV